MAAAASQGREQDVEARIEHARGQRNAEQVVAHGPGQILAHDAQGGAGQAKRRGNGGGLGAQQQHIAGLLGQVGARAHGDAGVGLGQRGGVVDAVAHHGHAQAARLQGANAGQLAGRVEAGFNLGDAGLLRDGRGGGGRVAGEHQHAQAGAGAARRRLRRHRDAAHRGRRNSRRARCREPSTAA